MSRILPLMLLCACRLSEDYVPEEFSSCNPDFGYRIGIEDVYLANPPVSIEGDTLIVDVEYGGGCGHHLFSICWPRRAFVEGDPVQVPLELWHGGGGDSCTAILSETLTFDLSPLKEAWKDDYGDTSGSMILDIVDAPEPVEYTFD